jgi:hypothetical protein
MSFDAKTARALSQRTHGVHDCLALMKKYVQQAAQAGEYEVSVGLSLGLPVPAGQSSNDAVFLVECFSRHGHAAWAEAVTHAAHAGYDLRPTWSRDERGALLDGVTLGWRWAEPPDASAGTLLVMPAVQARAISDAEQVHQRWVQAQRAAIERAAQQGLLAVTLHDKAPADDPAWAKRCEILQRAGFGTELIAIERGGAALVVSW